MEENMEKNIKNILGTTVKVITTPAGFYRDMPKTGGFVDPLIFAVALGLVSGVITAILSIFSLGSASSFWMGLAYIIISPVTVAIGSFIGAAIIFLIWKIMGSQEPYETAYRCIAYSMAIYPLMVIVDIIPYLGAIISLAWGIYLMVVASTEVHKISRDLALRVFGIIFILFAILSTCGQYTARKAQKNLEEYRNMTPEEAGKAVEDFMKGMKEEAEKNQTSSDE